MTTGESYLPNSVQWQWIPTTSRDSSASGYVQSTVTNEDGGIVTPKEAHSFCTTQHWSPINKHQIVLFVCVDRDFDWGGGRAYSTAEYNFIPSPSSDPVVAPTAGHSLLRQRSSLHSSCPAWLTDCPRSCLPPFIPVSWFYDAMLQRLDNKSCLYFKTSSPGLIMQIKVFPVQHSSWRRSYGHIWLATGNYCSPRDDNEGFIRRGGQFNYYYYRSQYI